MKERNVKQRSDDVQDILGQVTPSLIRWGITIIGMILLIFIVGSFFFKYPETLKANIVITTLTPPIGHAYMPAYGTGKLEKGQKVIIRLNNYPVNEYGFVTGMLDSITPIPDEKGLFHVYVELPQGLNTNYGITLPLKMQLTGTAEIVIEDKRLIDCFMPLVNKFYQK